MSFPEPLKQWAINNVPKDSIFTNRFVTALEFIIKILPDLLSDNLNTNADFLSTSRTKVIGVIIVNEITLPIVEILHPSGLKITIKYDLFDWVISIDSQKPVAANFGDLFDPDHHVLYSNFFGLTEDRIFPEYGIDHFRFSVRLQNEYEAYTFFWILGEALRLRRKK